VTEPLELPRDRIRELGTEGVRRGVSTELRDVQRDTGGDSQETTPSSSGSLDETVDRVLDGTTSLSKVETETKDGTESSSLEEVLETSAEAVPSSTQHVIRPSRTGGRDLTGRKVGADEQYLEKTCLPEGVGTRGEERTEEREEALDRGIIPSYGEYGGAFNEPTEETEEMDGVRRAASERSSSCDPAEDERDKDDLGDERLPEGGFPELIVCEGICNKRYEPHHNISTQTNHAK
jgi:hypothetical protein